MYVRLSCFKILGNRKPRHVFLNASKMLAETLISVRKVSPAKNTSSRNSAAGSGQSRATS